MSTAPELLDDAPTTTPVAGVATSSRAPEAVRLRRARLRTRLLVVLGVLAALALARAVAPADWFSWMDDQLGDGVTLALSVVIESVPFVVLGILLSILVSVWLPQGLLARRLPRNPVLRRLCLSLLGVLMPVCECGNLPLSRGLMLSGVAVADSVTFLLAAPIVNPITIITTYEAFGWSDGILVTRIVGGLVIANLVGWISSLHARPERLLSSRFRILCDAPTAESGSRTGRSLRMFAAESSSTLPALLVGSAVAGAIQVVVPRSVLLAVGTNPVLSVAAMMALAFVVAICSNVDAFFALSLGTAAMPGAIVAFLLFGPMIDVKMLALMRTTFSPRLLLGVTALVAASVAVIGLVMNGVG
ncbi:permease [Cnuibacter physcomitrellae]|uniref:permease n=1 Tax=Cnuibacter physcomitrellae TaxID=1619308 RepID=UPI00217570DA|nr:permease [Cnuibacter physcomitrellae]MCS5498847.1 permease [Cnuibacter physcomitrellae]